MNNSWNSKSWDDDWLDDYKTEDEKLADIATESLSQDPANDYGLEETVNLPDQEPVEVEHSHQRRKVSYGRKYSNYKLFTKEEAAKLFK